MISSPNPRQKTARTQIAQPWMALLDMNSYFATLEQQANPTLRGKPLGIVKDVGRSCLIAASKEAKTFGVKTGMRLADARRLCPHIQTLPADFPKYWHNTKLLRRIFKSLCPHTEIFSLDEAFLDLTSCRRIYANNETIFTRVRTQIQSELGEWVTFSLGFGANRLQAKLASDFAGPDRWFAITPENLSACLAEAEIDGLCGIGSRLGFRLRALGIHHPLQLQFVDDAFLIDHFGPFWGPELRRMGQGENSHLLNLVDRELPHMKSVGRSKTLFQANDDPHYIQQMIYNLTEDMCFKARRMKLVGYHVGIYLSDVDSRGYGEEQHLHTPVVHTAEVYDILKRLLLRSRWFRRPTNTDATPNHPRPAIIKIGVRLSALRPQSETTPSWLPSWQQQERMSAAVDAVNEKYGLYTVKPAKLLGFRVIQPEVTGFLGDRGYQLAFN